MRRAFLNGEGIFQQDLAPCCLSKKVKTIFQKYKLNVSECPGNSPELNPIENSWAITKSQLQKLDCTTMTKLIEAIIQAWYHDIQIKENSQKLVESMPDQMKEVLKNKEGHFNY